jgi:hypothetical protein
MAADGHLLRSARFPIPELFVALAGIVVIVCCIVVVKARKATSQRVAGPETGEEIQQAAREDYIRSTDGRRKSINQYKLRRKAIESTYRSLRLLCCGNTSVQHTSRRLVMKKALVLAATTLALSAASASAQPGYDIRPGHDFRYGVPYSYTAPGYGTTQRAYRTPLYNHAPGYRSGAGHSRDYESR